MTDYNPVVFRKPSFLASAVLGISALLITCVVSCTVIVVYGIHMTSDKTGDLFHPTFLSTPA